MRPAAETRRFEREVAPFQIDKFLERSKQLDLSGIALEDAAKHPVSPAEVRTIRFMQDTELFTVHYMKALLETAALADAEARAFLVVWAYEECSHGRALARFLEHAGHAPSRRSIEEFARPRRWVEVLQDLGGRLVSSLSTEFLAVHMTWGAINELTAVHAYARMAELSKNPVLAEIVRRMAKDERRHFAFYHQQAKRRLRTPLARRLAKVALRALWMPVGGSMAPQEDTDFVSTYLFEDAEGQARLAEIDATIAKLPGMEWFDLVTPAMNAGIARIRGADIAVERP
jgi:rubrerythrin